MFDQDNYFHLKSLGVLVTHLLCYLLITSGSQSVKETIFLTVKPTLDEHCFGGIGAFSSRNLVIYWA